MIECKYEVKPLPYRFCEGCMLNGCYSWNDSLLILCSNMGGYHPAILLVEQDKTVRACESFTPVTEKVWNDYLQSMKAVAKDNERIRLYAMDGKVLTSELLPAERAEKTERHAAEGESGLSADEMFGFIRNLDKMEHLNPKNYVIAVIQHYFTHVIYYDFPAEHGMNIGEEFLAYLKRHSAVNIQSVSDWHIAVQLQSFRSLFSRFFRRHSLTEANAQNLLQFIQVAVGEARKYE